MAFRVITDGTGTSVEVSGPDRRPPGRPRKDDARRVTIHVRVSEEEHADLLARARAVGVDYAELVRGALWPAQCPECGGTGGALDSTLWGADGPCHAGPRPPLELEEPVDCRPDDDADYGAAAVASAMDAAERRGGR